jgi:carboxyl-terminal processing protease
LKKNKYFIPIAIISIILIAFSLYSANVSTSSEKKSDEIKETYSYLEIFSEVLYLSEKNYVDQTDSNKLIEGAIERMLQGLDPESYLVKIDKDKPEIDYNQYFFTNFGINAFHKLYHNDEFITFISLDENSPFYKAGLRTDDQLLGIDNISLIDMGIYKFYQLLYDNLKNKKELKITYFRKDKSDDATVSIKDSKDNYSNLSFSFPNNETLMIHVSSFLAGTSDRILSRLSEIIKKEKPVNIILDLRNSGNGRLSESLNVADIFLKEGKIVSLIFKNKEKMDYTASTQDNDITLPMVVLINDDTIGLSEVVASSLKSRADTKLIGKKTYGAGHYQTDIQLNENFKIHLSTAKFIDNKDKDIENNGVEPDIIIENAKIDQNTKTSDPYIFKALEILKAKNFNK